MTRLANYTLVTLGFLTAFTLSIASEIKSGVIVRTDSYTGVIFPEEKEHFISLFTKSAFTIGRLQKPMSRRLKRRFQAFCKRREPEMLEQWTY